MCSVSTTMANRIVMQWAETLTRFVEERGLSGSICTLYELREGDTGQGQGGQTGKRSLNVC